MKRLVIGILIAMMMVSVAFADVDLSSMTTEELVELKAQVVGELMQRGEIKAAKVPAGEYTVGVDVPAGSYTITTSASLIMVTVDNGLGAIHTLSSGEEIGKLVLTDGQTLEIVGGTAVFTMYSGISFE